MDLKTAQESTLIGVVNEIYEQGEFICPVEAEVVIGETEIAEASDYEKAIFLTKNKVFKEKEKALQEAAKKFGEDTESEDDSMDDSIRNTAKSLQQQSETLKFLNDFFWGSIRRRLNLTDVNEIGIRRGWKIVKINEEAPPDCRTCEKKDTCPIKELLLANA